MVIDQEKYNVPIFREGARLAGGGTALQVVAFGVILGSETAGRLLFYEARAERVSE